MWDRRGNEFGLRTMGNQELRREEATQAVLCKEVGD